MLLISLLLALGLCLIFFEFFLPGIVFALIGSLSLIGSCIACFIYYPLPWAFGYLIAVPLFVLGTCKLALFLLEKSKKRGDFASVADQTGFVASTFDTTAIGKEGIVSTELKPAGHIVVEGKQHQALSEQGFLDKGTVVHILSGRGSYLVVNKKEKQ